MLIHKVHRFRESQTIQNATKVGPTGSTTGRLPLQNNRDGNGITTSVPFVIGIIQLQ